MIRDLPQDPPADPFLPTEGIHNLRDYGGYAVAEGARVKRGVLFRSGQHLEASDSDLETIQRLGIRTVIDLRGASERTRFPCRRHARFDAHVIAYDGETSNSPPHEGGGGAIAMTAEIARERMLAVYTRMPVNPAMIDIFSRYFDALATRDGASLVHCFAGKDRTGIAASLLLHVLGAHRDDVVGEYLRTNDAPTRAVLERQSLPRMEKHYADIAPEALANLMGVLPEYIETYFREVERISGSLDTYLSRTLGVDDDKKALLRERLLA
ncbi:MAG: tyrosine-protein phosphatase [Erythrobacter sp.]|uniref:tyrosine-protein phosphatase n=1 Tax=Erythrobacter sp. HL-111 TaxID=1798193 RepID=UPI0006DB66C6|nr:tyrosine-protein phosphatase [Erythrobacter sp. HL-111]KPP90139.1 MAG: protein-tyrosine phosphatase [Erythrobacteraceae bacterium HL-111]SDR81547.1 Protein tyrosine/serine phosphatase [Erythrobacter sp. HL-111]